MRVGRAFLLYVGFAATGVGVALPGALLPALMLRWHMSDEQGGRLFLMAWIGSSLGSLVVQGSLRRMLTAGCAAVSVAAAALGVCGGFAAAFWMLLYGIGLGVTMTSTSLLRQQQATRVSAEMVRLNLVWAVGAFLCPSLTYRALSVGIMQPLLFGLAGSFAILAGLMLLQPETRLVSAGRGRAPWMVFKRVPAPVLMMTLLITGVEAAAGGWLATYARRYSHSVAETIAAPTCFWAGLLLSRAFWSWGEQWFTAERIVRGSLMLMAAASLLLVATDAPAVVLVAGFLLGFGIGPVYPLLLAWALQFDRGGAIFFLAGVGSSCLPWLTGFISTERGSLREGLLVPMVASGAMMVMALTSRLGRWATERESTAEPAGT